MPNIQCLEASINEYGTFHEVIPQALIMKAVLKIPAIVCVLDNLIFKTTAKIKWGNHLVFKDCNLMLWSFHAIMMYMTAMVR